MSDIKQEVRQFYDQVGWSLVSDDIYQNARYEDLRPVARQYIHHCHLRLLRHISPSGHLLLDAGSGPIQYPEYLEYSRGYQKRVCADISETALVEARRRISEHGLFVQCDIAFLPFASEVFDGLVSLHTIHHLPEEEHLQAYQELQRVLLPGKSGVVVNGWPSTSSSLMRRAEPFIRLADRLQNLSRRLRKTATPPGEADNPENKPNHSKSDKPKGTFSRHHDAAWMKSEVGSRLPVEIWVWRSVSVRFLRSLVHTWLAGRLWLKLLYWLEERFPHYFGEHGQYPLIVLRKPA